VTGKKTYDYFKVSNSRLNDIKGNPLYEDAGKENFNALFEDRMSRDSTSDAMEMTKL
jgi:hypothetical protein